MYTVNQLNNIFTDFAMSHLQINSFGTGEIISADLDTKGLISPTLWWQFIKMTPEKHQLLYTYRFIAFDIPKDSDTNNKVEIISDQSLIILDILKWFKTGDFKTVYDIIFVGNSDILPFEDKRQNISSGCYIDIQFKTPEDYSSCDLPITPLSGTTSDDFVIVRNSDGSFSVQVSCGSTYTLTDVTYNIYVDGVLDSTLTVPAQTNQDINITN